MERTIKVSGIGKISLKPDVTIISVDCRNKCASYKEAMDSASNEVRIFQDAIEKAGVGVDSLKTTEFKIDLCQKNVRDEKGNYYKKYDGYEYYQSLVIRFDTDNRTLGKVLFHLSKTSLNNVEYDVRFGVKDTEKAKDMLLAEAIKDAKKKASIIAKEAGVTLGEIIDIQYCWNQVTFEPSRNMLFCVNRSKDFINYHFNPDDITEKDTVTLVYEIK